MSKAKDTPIPDDARRTVRFQMLLSLLATVLFGLAIVLGFELANAGSSGDRPACTVDTEARDCGPEETCVRGRFKPLPPILSVLACQEGDPCDGRCTCDGAFSCDDRQRCTAAPETTCAPEVAALLADLQRFERSQCKKVGEDASQCPPRALDHFFIDHTQFDCRPPRPAPHHHRPLRQPPLRRRPPGPPAAGVPSSSSPPSASASAAPRAS